MKTLLEICAIFFLIYVALKLFEGKEDRLLEATTITLIPTGLIFYLYFGITRKLWLDININVGLYLLGTAAICLAGAIFGNWLAGTIKTDSPIKDRIQFLPVFFCLLLWVLYIYEIYKLIVNM